MNPLARVIVLTLAAAQFGCLAGRQERVPPDFEYPLLGETVELSQPIEARRLAGRILDPAGAPVVKALVEIRSNDGVTRLAAAFTNAAGEFRIRDVGLGNHQLRVTKTGLKPLRVTVRITQSGSERIQLIMYVAT